MNDPQALRFLDSFLNYERTLSYIYPKDFSLERIRRLLDRLGNPEGRYETLHVAGTKGKGSTCAFLSSIARQTGRKVGLYTSPHLISFRERIQVDGRPITEEELAEAVGEIKPAAASDLTYFEVTTALAFLHFAKRKVDVAVIEVGLGGRLDATNVITPSVTCVTPISFDHMEKLGSTLRQIAAEKAGIVKEGVPVVVAPQGPEALDVIVEATKAKNAPIHLVGEEVLIKDADFSREGSRANFHTPERVYRDSRISLFGRHQLMNAACAIRMAELWSDRSGGLSEAAVKRALSETSWPGRCQLISQDRDILLDGAQNAASAQALRQTVEELFPGREILLVLGISFDKDLSGIAQVLGPWKKKALFVTRAQVPRAGDPDQIARHFRPWDENPVMAASVPEALERSREMSGPHSLIVVTGSLFVVAEALAHLQFSPLPSPRPLIALCPRPDP